MLRVLRELILSVIMAITLFLIIDTVTIRSHVVGPSMEPTLRQGQILLISRVGISGVTQQAYASVEAYASVAAYATTHQFQAQPEDGDGWVPPRGAIVTFYHPIDPQTMLVKRVIGLPGEEIAIKRGQVYINGAPLAEPYVVYHDSVSMPSIRIPQDSLFVMGDNRPESGDSRAFGPVPRSHLLGMVVLRYWPFTQLAWMAPRLP